MRAKTSVLRKQIREGIDSLERADFIELDVLELDDYFERLTAKAPQRLTRRYFRRRTDGSD